MSTEEHLADLKGTFPDAKVLYAQEIAIALNKSPTAIRRMLDKRQIPELKTYGGRLGVSLINFAKFLEEGDSANEKSTPEQKTLAVNKRKTKTSITKPIRSAPRLRDLIALATRQAAFWNELHAALEAISLGKKHNADHKRNGGL